MTEEQKNPLDNFVKIRDLRDLCKALDIEIHNLNHRIKKLEDRAKKEDNDKRIIIP